jgi:hypothetical protein
MRRWNSKSGHVLLGCGLKDHAPSDKHAECMSSISERMRRRVALRA